jgi:GNAT superfamily N-acetyltransferase
MRALLTWIRRKFAYTDLDRELNPPLLLPVRFRVYEERDFNKLMSLYRLNSAGRFPEGEEAAFAAHLRRPQNGMIVAEVHGRIVGCSGLMQLGKGIYTLCYSLVHPDYQRQRIGTTMTLLRVARTAIGNSSSIHHLLIFALPASLSFYRRFGFVDHGVWLAADGKEYPFAALSYSVHIARQINEILKWRGIQITGQFRTPPSPLLTAHIGSNGLGGEMVKLETVEPPLSERTA